MIRSLMVVYFLYLIAEGALRKWFFPEISTEIYIGKDVIVLFGLIAFLATDFRLSFRYFRGGELAMWALWVIFILGFFLFRSPSLASVAGLRYYLAPLPLLVLVPYATGDSTRLLRASNALLLITIPLCLLGVVQYLSPIDSEVNRYAWITSSGDEVASFGLGEDRAIGLELERPRITGTFSYISTYTAFLTAVVLVAWAALTGSRSVRGALLPSISLVLILTNLAMSGSRGPMGISLVLSIPFLFILFRRATIDQSYGIVVTAVLLVTCGMIGIYGLDALDAMLARSESAQDSQERALSSAIFPILTMMNIEPMGLGIGSTFAGLGELGSTEEQVSTFAEIVEDRAGAELGYLGYGLALYLKCMYLWKGWALYRACAKALELRVWALVALAVQLGSVWQIPFHNPVAASFYFAGIGLFMWVRYELSRRAAEGSEIRAIPAWR